MTDSASEAPGEEPGEEPGPVAQGGPGAVLKGRPGFREPPEDFVKAAEVAPDHWLSVVDRHWDGAEDEAPPHWAVLGRWRSDSNGQIVEWEANTDYRPSPDARGWAPPVSPADAAAQLVATGYGTEELFALALAQSDVAVCVDEQGEFTVTEVEGGALAVPVFSTSPRLDADRLPPHEVMPVPDLLDRMPEGRQVLFVSSSAPVGQLVTPTALRKSQAELARYEEEYRKRGLFGGGTADDGPSPFRWPSETEAGEPDEPDEPDELKARRP